MTTDDQTHAAELDQARTTLNEAGAARLERRPWEHPGQPRSDADLVRFAAWAARDAQGTDPAVLAAGLRLLSSARVELDQIEAGLLFAARGSGMTWPQVAETLGLGSAQAAQQRLNRVLARAGDRDAEA
ncbi:hypothetical protein ACFVKB_31215 [Rhodococcus sp. NPDC127530]|uniref:hypothetical protein n=1 Tax=unclassified Rhodococcus (in: high G+C Gram-positive bacteria) TaxID=192944 RepID=UPI00363D0675